MKINQRLDALTSLRFFAASMIVFHHLIGNALFNLTSRPEGNSALGQGVSFFFVLSGFILFHVYPKLDTWAEKYHFWRARIARIWPALVFSLLLYFLVSSAKWEWKTALPNLLMVQAWIPDSRYFYSYNAPSWSISTEFFFYLVFPFLLINWNKNWWVKLAASCFVVISAIFALDFLFPASYDSIMPGILYISPTIRIFEFIFGMCISFFWHESRSNIRWSESRATFYEMASVLLFVASMLSMHFLEGLIIAKLSRYSLSLWISTSGSMFAAGVLIYVISIGRGRISRWLSSPPLVLLGEISFSLYLIHQILIRFYQNNIAAFPKLPDPIPLAIFWVVLLLFSYLMWAIVENPSRQLILRQRRPQTHATGTARDAWARNIKLNKNIGFAAITLSSLIMALNVFFDHSAIAFLKSRNIEISSDNLAYFASQGDLEVTARLIEAGTNINATTSTGSNALIDSINLNAIDAVSYVLAAGANVNFETAAKVTPLEVALKHSDGLIALSLIEHGAEPNHVDSRGSTYLIEATKKGNLPVVKALLAKGASPDYEALGKLTALDVAFNLRSESIALLLIEYGANPNHIGSRRNSYLLEASWQGNLPIAKALLAKGADPNYETSDKLTPLEAAINQKHDSLALVLIEHGANPDHVDSAGNSYLIEAIRKGNLQTVKSLLAKGVNPNLETVDKLAPLEIAFDERNDSAALTLIEYGANPNRVNKSGSTYLVEASWRGNLSIVKALLSKGVDPNLETRSGSTPLSVALTRKNEAVAVTLIAHVTNPNRVDPSGSTYLIEASWNGISPAVKALLTKGADPNYVRPTDGLSAMKAAISSGNLDIAKTLKESGAR
jgi:peptidoglycan/LPS O-acetylase OafA/YrhL/ankyrin repeat protein